MAPPFLGACRNQGLRSVSTGGVSCDVLRTGSVAITVNREPTHTVLGKIVEPGRWKVTLMGPRAGVFFVSIDCNCLSQELNASLGETASGLDVTSLKECGGPSYGSELLRVTSPGKQPAFIRSTWSCGSGGCGQDFAMAYQPKDAEALFSSKCK